MTSATRAIIHITTSGKNFSKVNYSRRMYAVLRRYTPDAVEYGTNECLADLTGLRTFYKMSYKELASNILADLEREIGIPFTLRVGSVKTYEVAKNNCRAQRSISTYKELNKLFSGLLYVPPRDSKGMFTKRKKLTIPFLGKVA